MRPILRVMIVCAALLPAVLAYRPVRAHDDERHGSTQDDRHDDWKGDGDGDHHWNRKTIELVPLGVYNVVPFHFDEGAVEISAYDPRTQHAFLTFAEKPRVEVVDLSNPSSPQFAFSIDLTPWGDDRPRDERGCAARRGCRGGATGRPGHGAGQGVCSSTRPTANSSARSRSGRCRTC